MGHVQVANKPFPSSPRPMYQKVKCSVFDLQMIFHSHANKTHFHKKGCTLGLILKVRVFGTRKWPIVMTTNMAALSRGGKPRIARYLTLALGP